MKTGIGLGAAALAASVVLCASFARSDPSGDPGEGRKLYETHCQFCHGVSGKGDGPLAPELRVTPADLTTIAKRRAWTFPEVEVREIIDGRRPVRAHGGNEMPIWGRIFGDTGALGDRDEAAAQAKIGDLVAYLRSIQVSPPRTVGQR
ncbi:MAG: c-type cytochrome [Myxococcota bacterium]